MNFFLRRVCPIVAIVIFVGGLWLWIGGTFFESHKEIKSMIVINKNPESLFMNIFGLYFFLKCTFCSMVLLILSRWFLLKVDQGNGQAD